ncbi:hypothetical protein BV25DRAFT_1851290 [Artomyces pyxidatus]|uniref:Uncharacterized protein n=1 Tax=Artomyces pyxidatus TaxID=48021 RepID=A0ACB8T8I4_9AGAM|nr:hypothetical protein BV25DRAFT_1851290 [Artomyces pyxidatus]
MPRKQRFDRSRTCVKCKVNLGNLVIRHAVYCKECFTPLIASRFRHAFEPHINLVPAGPRRGLLKPSGDLLIGFSGGLGSTVLLDLVHRTYIGRTFRKEVRGGKEHPRNDRVWTNIRVCYVDISDAFPEMENRTYSVQKAVETYEDFEFVLVRLQDAFDLRWWEKVSGNSSTLSSSLGIDLSSEDLLLSSTSPPDSTPVSAMRTYLTSLPTLTAIHSTISTLIRLLLLYTARSTRSSHVVLGTSLTSLSISLISSISQGGGFVVPQTVQEEWVPAHIEGHPESRAGKGVVRLLRPLREVGMKECTAWAWWNQLPIPGKQRIPVPRHTIGDLTKDFIVGLEKDYPSTVSTIAKTVGKLAPKGEAGRTCAMCELPAQSVVQEWKSRISIRSFTGLDPSGTDASNSLAPFLCYSCHTTLTSRSSRGTGLPKAGGIPALVAPPVWSQARLAQKDHADAQLGTNSLDGLQDRGPEIWETKSLKPDEMKAVVDEFIL